MRIALYQPDIPQNTGTVLRLGACLGLPVDIIGPTGFDVSERALRRAGLDYLEHVDLTRHRSWNAFLAARIVGQRGRIILSTTHGTVAHHTFKFGDDDTLLFGRESAGVPADVHNMVDARIRIPLVAGLRSLNLAVSVGIVAAEALRQRDLLPK